MADLGPVHGEPTSLLLVHFGRDWIRGSERCLLDLVAGLDRSRFNPVVWCTSAVLRREAGSLGAQAFPLRLVDEGRPWWKPDRALVAQATELMRRHDIRLVHANDLVPLPGLLWAARRATVPMLAHIHLNTTRMERIWSGVHQASLVVGVSRSALSGLAEDGMPQDSMRVVYNGIAPPRIERGDARGLRQALGIGAPAFVAAFVGSLIGIKRVPLLLQAIAMMAGCGLDVHALIVGDGTDRPMLEQMTRDLGATSRVHFLGEREDAGAILRDACDVLVAPSSSEAFPLVPLEAGYFEIPVVASDIPPHRESVLDGVTGLLVPLDDTHALVAALERLYSDRMLGRALGVAGGKRVRSEFLVSRYAQELVACYDRLLALPRSRLSLFGGWRWPPCYSSFVAARFLGMEKGRAVLPVVAQQHRGEASAQKPR